MAKFRQNHSKHSKSNNFLLRGVIVTAVLIGIMIFGFIKLMNDSNKNADHKPSNNETTEVFKPSSDDESFIDINDRDFLPKSQKSETVHHTYYSLGYNEQTEQSDWVAYALTKQSLKAKNVKRERYFTPDKDVSSKSAVFGDYKNSGFTKGHLAPAGDMAFSKQAMKETFYMSNMSPQIRQFNNGVWKELEENIRDWAYSKDELYVMTGPIFYSKEYKKIGNNRVGVPDAFYKILVDEESSNRYNTIAFVIPHAKTDLPLKEFATTVDEVESLTNIDFLYRFYKNKTIEEEQEKTFDMNKWPVSEARYRSRVTNWNNQK